MISLGCFDSNVSADACDEYLKQLETVTRQTLRDVSPGPDKISLTSYQAAQDAMRVAAVQQALQTIGFFPGGKIDGICGYRS